MRCPNCKRHVGQLKKYQYIYCECGEQLMCVADGKSLKLVILGENKGEDK